MEVVSGELTIVKEEDIWCVVRQASTPLTEEREVKRRSDKREEGRWTIGRNVICRTLLSQYGEGKNF